MSEDVTKYSADTTRARELLAQLVSKPDATIDDYRSQFEEMCSNFLVPDDAKVQEVDAGGTPAVWVSAPGTDQDTVVIVLHGGGFIMGSATGYTEFGYRLSKAANARALVVDYRLAPEAQFPAPIDDAVAAYRFVRSQPNVRKVVLVGDSAGGGLAFSTLVTLRDAGEQLPDAVVTISALLDFAGKSPSLTDRAHLDPLPTAGMIEMLAGVYLGGVEPTHPIASPLYSELAGLPAAFILVGSDEGLYDDSIRIAEKLERSGVPTQVEVGEGLPHIWPVFSFHPEAVATTERIGDFIRAQVAAPL